MTEHEARASRALDGVARQLTSACDCLVVALEHDAELNGCTVPRERCAYLANRLSWLAHYGGDLARLLAGLANEDAACLEDGGTTTDHDVLAAVAHHARTAEESFRNAWHAATATRYTYEPLLTSPHVNPKRN